MLRAAVDADDALRLHSESANAAAHPVGVALSCPTTSEYEMPCSLELVECVLLPSNA